MVEAGVRGAASRAARKRAEALVGVGMPARVLPLTAVPICLIVALVVPSPGVRSSARRLREARRAGRLMEGIDVGCGAPGGVSAEAV